MNAATQEKNITIEPGDTITQLLKQHHVPLPQINRLLSNNTVNQTLSHLQIGRKIKIRLDNHQLSQLEYPLTDNKFFRASKGNNGSFSSKIITIPFIKSIKYQSAIIHTTLSQAGQSQHIPESILKQAQNIFRGTVNFNSQIQPNDKLEVMYNEYYENGKASHPGLILLAKLHLKNKTKTAILFSFDKKHHGYYALNGAGMEPLFLRVPLHYKRISSKFSYHRLDPITHKIQPHLGVDYAAPRGTPIHSVGNGLIIFKGKDHGYGNAIKIRYNKNIMALYAHMSRFANVHNHEHVSKGEVIGYVGMTGWATGPHLHFGWYVNGVAKNPLKRKIIFNPRIPATLHHAFALNEKKLLAELQLFNDRNSTNTP